MPSSKSRTWVVGASPCFTVPFQKKESNTFEDMEGARKAYSEAAHSIKLRQRSGRIEGSYGSFPGAFDLYCGMYPRRSAAMQSEWRSFELVLVEAGVATDSIQRSSGGNLGRELEFVCRYCATCFAICYPPSCKRLGRRLGGPEETNTAEASQQSVCDRRPNLIMCALDARNLALVCLRSDPTEPFRALELCEAAQSPEHGSAARA